MEKEVSEAEKRLAIRKKYLEKIEYGLKKNIIEQPELTGIIRGFFAEYLKLDYEFTYEELTAELEKEYIKPELKEEIDKFLLDLSESEYFLDAQMEQEAVRQSLEHLRSILLNIMPKEVVTEKKSILERFIPILYKEKKPPVASEDIILHKDNDAAIQIELPPVDVTAQPTGQIPTQGPEVRERGQTFAITIEDNNPRIITLYELIEEAYLHLNAGKPEDARVAYKRALDAYNSLENPEQEESYFILYDLFLKLSKEAGK